MNQNKYKITAFLSGFHNLENREKIRELTFGFDSESKRYFVSLIVPSKNNKVAENIGMQRIKQILGMVTIYTGINYEIVDNKTDQISGKIPFIHSKTLRIKRRRYVPLPENLTNRIEEALENVERLPKKAYTTIKIRKAIDYCFKGCFFQVDWKSEAFLNFYKVIELISQDFKKQFDKEIVDQLKNTVIKNVTEEEISSLRSSKRLIEFACEKLSINYKYDISKIVNLRPRFSAHASIKEVIVSEDEFNDCKILALNTIINYIDFIYNHQFSPQSKKHKASNRSNKE